MHLFDFGACTEYALVVPKILQVVATDPLIRALELISHGRHEAMLLG